MNKKFKFTLLVVSVAFLLISNTAQIFAIELIVPIPTPEQPGGIKKIDSPAEYIQTLFQFGIGIGFLLAVGTIVFGGIVYIVQQGNIAKQLDAKEMILNAIWGLVLLLGSVLILTTINPNLTTLGLPNLKDVKIKPISGPSSASYFKPESQEKLTENVSGIVDKRIDFNEFAKQRLDLMKQLGVSGDGPDVRTYAGFDKLTFQQKLDLAQMNYQYFARSEEIFNDLYDNSIERFEQGAIDAGLTNQQKLDLIHMAEKGQCANHVGTYFYICSDYAHAIEWSKWLNDKDWGARRNAKIAYDTVDVVKVPK